MLVDLIRTRATQALKLRDSLSVQILRVLLGEIQTGEARAGRDLSDEEVVAIVRKLMKSNDETLGLSEKPEQKVELTRENEVLRSLVPTTLDATQILAALAPVADAIRAAKNDGQATGVAMKQLKSAGATVEGTEVAKVVQSLRAAK